MSIIVWKEAASLAVCATQAAARACYPHIGKGDKIAADASAVEAISKVLNNSRFELFVAIGEGELDSAPMLNVGDVFGCAGGYKFDVAVDPLEGTTLCSLGLPGSVSALVFGASGSILSAPDSYMKKIMAGPLCPDELVDTDISITELIPAFASALHKNISDVTVCVLDKPRHADLIETIRVKGASVLKIPDADIPAAIWVCKPDIYGVDLYLGTGGGPEGVLSAAALKSLGGKMSARFEPQDNLQLARLTAFDNRLIGTKLSLLDLVSDDVIFAMSSITGSKGLAPISMIGNELQINSICLTSILR